MKRKEEIRNKSYELGQRYFPDAHNIWARANLEAQFTSSACEEIAQWADRTMIDKACEWITEHIDIPYEGEFVDDSPVASDYIEWCEKRLEYAKAIADAFKENFKELIEICKELL